MIFSLARAFRVIEKGLKEIDLKGQPNSLYEPIAYILDLGGKRLRPTLTLYAHHIFSDEIHKVIKPALSVEVFHNFTLMHDDIMDQAPLRRGKATVQAHWNENVAILAGDAMLVKAYQLLEDIDLNISQKVIRRFNETSLHVCEGQMLDMDFEKQNEVSEPEYLEMIKLKTSVLLGFSLELGALVAGADEKTASKLYEIGVNVGLGFQIKDDLLDLYGDAGKVGKQVGGDIISNKKTYLLIKFLELADKEDRKEAFAWLAKKEFAKEEKIKYFKSKFDAYQVNVVAENMINQYFDKAMLQLDALSANLLRKGKLRRLLLDLIEREN